MTDDLEGLFATHRHRLFRYFCRAVGHAETARDLTQDVFLRVSRSEAAPAAGQVNAWLFRIARNLALDYHRRRRRQSEPSELVDAAARAPLPDVAISVNEALASLADLDRDIFLMREVAGLGYAEIAAACGQSADAVRSRIHRARLQLRTLLAAPILVRRQAPMRRSGQS